jgi:hypothetical protein
MKDSQQEREEKINSLKEMIANAEQTISSAKQMLSHLQGGEPVSPQSTAAAPVPESFSPPTSNGERVIHGTFNGQIMIGEDGRNYPVQANYASKSKLVEGDMLKLTITPDGNFMYKQIGPIDRKYLIGIVQRDDRGNFIVQTEEKIYRVLLAAATYFKIEEGDEVTIVVPKVGQSEWGAIENVVRKAGEEPSPVAPNPHPTSHLNQTDPREPHNPSQDSEPKLNPSDSEEEPTVSALQRLEEEIEQERRSVKDQDAKSNSPSQEEADFDELDDLEALKLDEDDDSLEEDWEEKSDEIAQDLNEDTKK